MTSSPSSRHGSESAENGRRSSSRSKSRSASSSSSRSRSRKSSVSARGGEKRGRSRSPGAVRDLKKKEGLGDVNTNVVSPALEEFTNLVVDAFKSATNSKDAVGVDADFGTRILRPLDFLCMEPNASVMKVGVEQLGEDKVRSIIADTVKDAERSIKSRSDLMWPYMFAHARLRRSVRNAGVKGLSFDGEGVAGGRRGGAGGRDRNRGGRDRSYSPRHRSSRNTGLSSRDKRRAEDFIEHNRLDKRCEEILLYHLSGREVSRVIDEGFDIRSSNPSREVMLRMRGMGIRRDRSRSRSRSVSSRRGDRKRRRRHSRSPSSSSRSRSYSRRGRRGGRH